MTMVVGYAGRGWGFLAHSTRPRVSDGEAVWHEDIEVPGVSLFGNGAVATQGDLPSSIAVHAALAGAESAPLEAHAATVRRAQSRRPRHNVATLLTVGPDGMDLVAVNWGASRSGYEGPPVDRFPSGALVVMPPGCWPVDDTHAAENPPAFAALERDLTVWLGALGDEVPPSEEVAQRVGLLYRVAAEVTPSVAPVPEVAYFVGDRGRVIIPRTKEALR